MQADARLGKSVISALDALGPDDRPSVPDLAEEAAREPVTDRSVSSRGRR